MARFHHDIWCSLAHRGDSLNDAFAAIEDTPEDRLRNDSRERIFAILAKERDIAWAAAKRYAENFKRQEEAGVVDGG